MTKKKLVPKTIDNLSELKTGDLVLHCASSSSYIITSHYGNHVTATRTVEITSPIEWVVFRLWEEPDGQAQEEKTKEEKREKQTKEEKTDRESITKEVN